MIVFVETPRLFLATHQPALCIWVDGEGMFIACASPVTFDPIASLEMGE